MKDKGGCSAPRSKLKILAINQPSNYHTEQYYKNLLFKNGYD